jgi:hypothetical protein
MMLIVTDQKTRGRKLETSGNKKRLVHALHQRTFNTYCGTVLSNPIEFEGEETEVTCPRCLKVVKVYDKDTTATRTR